MRRTAAVAAVAVTTLAFSSPALAAVPDPAVEFGTLYCYAGSGDQVRIFPVRTVTTPSGQEVAVCP